MSKDTAKRFIMGEEEAYALVYQEYRQVLYFYLRSLLRRKEDAEDAFQETFAKAIEHHGSIGAPERLQSYLFSCAHNAALDRLRANQEETLEEESVTAFDQRRFDDFLPYDLGKQEKEIVVYRLVFGFSWNEVASILDISVSGAKAKYANALKQIKGALKA